MVGVTTVIINRRHGACGRCADFVGMVFIDDVYAGGKPTDAGGKYPLLSDAMKSGLFHPRCKDSSSPYFEGISTRPIGRCSRKKRRRISPSSSAPSRRRHTAGGCRRCIIASANTPSTPTTKPST